MLGTPAGAKEFRKARRVKGSILVCFGPLESVAIGSTD
jgi:hypothetical protein